MFQRLFDRLSSFIFQDVRRKSETKDKAVLIRFLDIVFAFGYLVTGISVAFLQHYYLGLIIIAAIGMLVASFICTYEDHTNFGMGLLVAVLIIFPSLLTVFVGFDLDYHMPLYILLLLLFYNKSSHPAITRFMAVFICAYTMCLVQFSSAFSNARHIEGAPRIFVQSFNVLLFAFALISTAFCFGDKFNQAQDKLRESNEELKRAATLDPLTQLPNRRYMNEQLKAIVHEYNRNGKPFCIAIGDVDKFKSVNDTRGHDCGDAVLKVVADTFRSHMAGVGPLARWGGEEFLLVFRNMDIKQAAQSLEKLRSRIESTNIEYAKDTFHITMSFGVEEFNDRMGVEATINTADAHLYKAKETGRNRVITQ
ncbi:MAG: GGDEF domain-containing protein [Lachnospiraceae bacterium]|nr:GGDEF domain-containing protein [Lachnospiraceae bacterium]